MAVENDKYTHASSPTAPPTRARDRESKTLGMISPEMRPVVYVHVVVVIAAIFAVLYYFGVLAAVGAAVLVSSFWVWWVNQKQQEIYNRELAEKVAMKRAQGFSAPPPELYGEEPRRGGPED